MTISTSELQLRSVAIPSLGAGASPRTTGLATVPSTLAPGTYYLVAIADCTLCQGEINESNNIRSGARIVVTQ